MKTFQQKIEIVENAIRKALPRTKKLSKGCKILFDLNEVHTDVVGEIIGIDDANVAIVITEDLAQRRVSLKNFDEQKIIGHDILLSDVLEWLQLVGDNNIEINYDFLSFSIKRNMFYNGDFGYKYVNWDLSKSCLKYQNEVVIAFLYDLIKNERTI